ncbi:MAG: phosphatase PAP2 family protein [Treponema sp.]|nr:phosphatase PAP2 family protein [Treponema sp.]
MQFLLWLQDIRMRAGTAVETAVAVLSDTTPFLVVLMCLLYVMVDKKKFCHVLFCYSICVTLNALVKITACVYRPWVRDARIVPTKISLAAATGYSFPSGHASAASACSMQMIKQYKHNKLLAVVLILYICAIAFTRMFLGCHTPQDVLVAVAEGFLALLATAALMAFVEKKEGNDKIVFAAANALIAALVAFALLKPYPVDLDAAGNILVDPKRMQNDAMFDFSFALGFIHAWFLEKRFVKFSTDGIGAKQRILRAAVEAIFGLVINLVIYSLAKNYFDKRLAKFIKGYLYSFAAAYLAPLVFTKIERALKW